MIVKYVLSKIPTKQKKISLSTVYRPLDYSLKEFKNSLKQNFDNIHRSSKDLYLVEDFNINILDYENNVKVRHFVNFASQNN